MIKLNPIYAVMLRQFYLIRSSVTRIIPLFIWGAIDIIIWGFTTKFLNQFTNSGLDLVATLLGAVLVWDFMTRIMHGTCMVFMEDSWSRNFLNMFASPMRTSEYVTGLVLTGIVTSMVGLVIMLALAIGVFGLSVASYGIVILPLVLVIVLFAVAMGILGCALMLRYGPSGEWFVWPIPALVAPFVGVFYPLATLPVWMQYLARILPPSYVFETMRSISAGHGYSAITVLFAIGLAILYIIFACWVFIKVYRYAVRTGLIARYSAETVI